MYMNNLISPSMVKSQSNLLIKYIVLFKFLPTNLGMLGIDNFDAIINPPQTSILSVGKIIKEPVVDLKTEQIVPGSTMSVNLSVDHRAIDGALGAKFLDRIAFYLESPLRIFH